MHAKKAGITDVNLWDDTNKTYSINLKISPDAKEVIEFLKEQFPRASLTVRPTASGVIVSGYVDQADDVSRIVALVRTYYPEVINNIRIGGTPQVILHVKVMEVSRTKLRQMGVDFAAIWNSGNNFFSSTAAGVGKLTGVSQVVGAGQQAITSTVGRRWQHADRGTGYRGCAQRFLRLRERATTE